MIVPSAVTFSAFAAHPRDRGCGDAPGTNYPASSAIRSPGEYLLRNHNEQGRAGALPPQPAPAMRSAPSHPPSLATRRPLATRRRKHLHGRSRRTRTRRCRTRADHPIGIRKSGDHCDARAVRIAHLPHLTGSRNPRELPQPVRLPPHHRSTATPSSHGPTLSAPPYTMHRPPNAPSSARARSSRQESVSRKWGVAACKEVAQVSSGVNRLDVVPSVDQEGSSKRA